MTLEQGDLLYNRYRILDILGRGGMGSVYHAVDESLGVEVAVKENMFVTEEYAQQFRLEAGILASLRHPNLPRVTDHFTIEHQGQYLVMDYIEGQDLRHMMDDGPLSEEEALRIGVAVCDALAYLHMHQPPILHRDIKPGNVRVAPNGQIYLLDFGLAKMGNEGDHTLTGARALTPGYSPPEQYGTSHTDARTDIYSLGAMLYAALTGVIPEDGLARLMGEVKLTPVRRRNPKVSKRVAAVVEKALEPQAAKRYQSAKEFKQALLDIESEPSETAPDEALEQPVVAPSQAEEKEEKSRPQPRKVSPLGCVLLIALLIVLTSGIGWAVNNPTSARQSLNALLAFVVSPTPTKTATISTLSTPTVSASKPTKILTAIPVSMTATQTLIRTSTPVPVPTETLIPSLTPTQIGAGTGEIAFASMQAGLPQIFLVNVDGSNLQALTHELNGACQPAWSPDGKKLVYVSPCADKSDQYRKSSLYILDLESGETIPLPALPGGSFEPAWSPGGTKIAFTSMPAGLAQIFVLNLTDQSIMQLTHDTGNVQSSQAAWSPDGKHIIYTVRRFNLLQIWTMASDKTNQVQLIRSGGGFSDYLPAWSPDGSFILFSETNANGSSPSSLMRFVLGAEKAETVSIPLQVVDVNFSPDGNWIVYETSGAENQDIYIDDLSGGTPQRLTNSTTVDFDPAWRP